MAFEDTVNVPIPLIFSGHLLISIRNSMAALVTKMAVRDTEIEGRIATLERHDSRNEDERLDGERWLRRKEQQN